MMWAVSGDHRKAAQAELPVWRFWVRYESGEEREVEVEAVSMYQARQLASRPSERDGSETASAVVLQNPIVPSAAKRKALHLVEPDEVERIVVEHLRKKGVLDNSEVTVFHGKRRRRGLIIRQFRDREAH